MYIICVPKITKLAIIILNKMLPVRAIKNKKNKNFIFPSLNLF